LEHFQAWPNPTQFTGLLNVAKNVSKMLVEQKQRVYNGLMTPKLTPELDQALQSNGMPLEVVGAGAKHYVIITLEQFQQMQQVLAYDDSELSDDEKIAAASLVVEDGPEMAEYDNYDVNRPQK
jgi:hypothetical protein